MNKHHIVGKIIEEKLHSLRMKIKKEMVVMRIQFMNLNKVRNQNKVKLYNLRFQNLKEQ